MLGGLYRVLSLPTVGEPEKHSEFWVRGIGTFGANQGALVLIDGLEGSLSQIDPGYKTLKFLRIKDASMPFTAHVKMLIVRTGYYQNAVKWINWKLQDVLNLTVSHLQNMPEYLGAYDYAKLAKKAKTGSAHEELLTTDGK